ncbi:MAG: thrombospondin type 3 repeat-containing protein [Deltaproteobacteria bacterium]|nr:thrombospondin type 3 repeat-containing protein [Deltaproteobacteria bacterium]
MDLCWPFRLIDAMNPASSALGNQFLISSGTGSTDGQGLQALPALVCDPVWLDQWFHIADRMGRTPGSDPDGFVISDELEDDDTEHWSEAHSEPDPEGWYWERDGDMNFEGCWDYLDGGDRLPIGEPERCTLRDFDYWNTVAEEFHPDGLQYISRDDVRRWAGFECPALSKYGVEGFPDFATDWNPIYFADHLGVGDKIWFAPNDDAKAFCRDPSSGAEVPMLPEAWRGVSRLTARWVDVDGRPALRVTARVGAEVGAYMDLLGWAHMAVGVTAVNLNITIQPRLCDGLRGSDFCVHKTSGGSCDRVAADPPVGEELCGSETVMGGALADAKSGEARGYGSGTTVDEEPDWNGPDDDQPERLVLANNGVLYHLDVSASIERKYEPTPSCYDPFLGWALCLAMWGYAEGELEDAESKQAATMFNTLAKAVYFGMKWEDVDTGDRGYNDCVHVVPETGECDWYEADSGNAAAAHYLRRWFWQPAIDRVPHGLYGLDVTRAPDPRAVRFTDIRWSSLSHYRDPEFNFVWDKDLDGVGEEADNCPNVYNPEQCDSDRDCIGNACENDFDGDHCCEGGCESGCEFGGSYLAGCICGGSEPAPGCAADESGRTCHDDDVELGSWGCLSGTCTRDRDDDGVPDDCDADEDGDGFDDAADACDEVWTTYDWDYDADGVGNACDDSDDHDRCWDPTECAIPDFMPPEPLQPCGEAACVNGQCRIGTEASPYGPDVPFCGCKVWDFGSAPPRCVLTNCESVGQVCVYHPAAGTGITDTSAFGCEPIATTEPFSCSLLSGGPPGSPLAEGGVEDLFETTHLERYSPYHEPPRIATLIPCLPETGDDCCRTCVEPILRVLAQNGSTLTEIRPMAALDRPIDDFTGMDVTVVPDINANGNNDIVVSLPYAANEQKGVVGTIVTFDGYTGEVLRTRERDGSFGTLMSRAGDGMGARFRPLGTLFSGSLAVGSIVVSADQPAGISLLNRWGIEVGFVADNPNIKSGSPTRMTGSWIQGQELALVYSATCDFSTDKGCLVGYDQYGAIKWSASGYQSGNEFGASVDSDGTYLVVGVPGYNAGTGGMVQVLRPGWSWSRNITQRGRVRDLGRRVAIADTASGPRVLATARVNDVPVVLEFSLNGRLRATYTAPDGWKIIDVVSPAFNDGITLDLFAIVYLTPDGHVFHQMFHADGANLGR